LVRASSAIEKPTGQSRTGCFWSVTIERKSIQNHKPTNAQNHIGLHIRPDTGDQQLMLVEEFVTSGPVLATFCWNCQRDGRC